MRKILLTFLSLFILSFTFNAFADKDMKIGTGYYGHRFMGEKDGISVILNGEKDFLINGKKYNLDNELKNLKEFKNKEGCYFQLDSVHIDKEYLHFVCPSSLNEHRIYIKDQCNKLFKNYGICKYTNGNLFYSTVKKDYLEEGYYNFYNELYLNDNEEESFTVLDKEEKSGVKYYLSVFKNNGKYLFIIYDNNANQVLSVEKDEFYNDKYYISDDLKKIHFCSIHEGKCVNFHNDIKVWQYKLVSAFKNENLFITHNQLIFDYYDPNPNLRLEALKEVDKRVVLSGKTYGPYKDVKLSDFEDSQYYIVDGKDYYINGNKVEFIEEITAEHSPTGVGGRRVVGFSYKGSDGKIYSLVGNQIFNSSNVGHIDTNTMWFFNILGKNTNIKSYGCFNNDSQCFKNGVQISYENFNKYFVDTKGQKYGPYEEVRDGEVGSIFIYKKGNDLYLKLLSNNKENSQTTNNQVKQETKFSPAQEKLNKLKPKLDKALDNAIKKLSKEKLEKLNDRLDLLLVKEKNEFKKEAYLYIKEYLNKDLNTNDKDNISNTDYQLTKPKNGDTVAIIKTNKGDIKIKLFPKETPLAVKNFIGLASKGYYNDVTFHRVIKNFMIQGGDPTGTGEGGDSIYGYKFEDEFSHNLGNIRGALSMASDGKSSTNGSQFFINHVNNNFLDGHHTVFGQVYEGIEKVDEISETKTDSNDKPLEDVKILSVEIMDYSDKGLIKHEFK